MAKHNLKSVFYYLKVLGVDKFVFKNASQKRKAFIKYFFINLLIVSLLSIITGFLRIKFNISFNNIDLQLSIILLLNFTLIPVLEEIAYRLPLIYRKNNIVLSFSIITYFITSIFLANGLMDISTNIYLRIAISGILGVSIFFLLGIKSIEEKLLKFWKSNSKLIFYIFLLLFTFGHIENYELSSVVLLLMPILLLPQFIGGIFLSFIRIKFGFGYSVFFHIAVNLVALSPQVILLLFLN